MTEIEMTETEMTETEMTETEMTETEMTETEMTETEREMIEIEIETEMTEMTDDRDDRDYLTINHQEDYDRKNSRSDNQHTHDKPIGSKLSERLKDILDDDNYSNISAGQSSRNSRSNNRREENYDPPSLAQLEKGGEYTGKKYLPDAKKVALSEEEEDDLKRELLFKFDLLRKSYKNSDNIPEFTIHSDYKNMTKAYETTVKRLSVDSNVESYKNYLTGGFMLFEFILGTVLKFDMKGFTQQQIINMSSYEKLLIELGEKTYVPEDSRWPVELRLLFLVVINSAMFIGGKMIMKKTGSNLMGMMNKMKGPPVKRTKMKGPTVDLDDIPDFDT